MTLERLTVSDLPLLATDGCGIAGTLTAYLDLLNSRSVVPPKVVKQTINALCVDPTFCYVIDKGHPSFDQQALTDHLHSCAVIDPYLKEIVTVVTFNWEKALV